METRARFVGPLAARWGERTSVGGIDGLLLDAEACLPVPPAAARGVWALDDGTADQLTIRRIKQVAESEMGTPWPQPTAHAYARYFRDGDREEYQRAVFGRQERLTRAVVTAAATLDEFWIDEAADGIVLLCEQSSWCWPAHDDTFRRRGAVLPTVSSPFLDLGAGEVVAQLAWADHLLGAQFDARVPGLRARVRHEAMARVFTPFLERRDWHWLGLDGRVHNWNPWIHGNVLVAALRLITGDESQLRARVVASAVEGIDRYVASLPLDGAVDEGYSYWWNGVCRALEALDVLFNATAGALDASAVPQLRATVAFPYQMHIGGPWYLNLADGCARPPDEVPWHALHRAAVFFGDEQARLQAAAHRSPDQPVATESAGLGRLLRAVTDAEWAETQQTQPPLIHDVWLPSTQVLAARTKNGSQRGMYLAVKGGHNGENHNHNDIGSAVVALNGVPVVVDPGRPTYTAQTFGPDRYQIWTMQSSWHSTPEIRGTAQSPGERFAARSITVTRTATRVDVCMDLAAAYDRADIRHWWRTACLDRAAERVEIIDEWDLAPRQGEQASQIHFLLAGEVQDVADDHVLITALDDASVMLMAWTGSVARPKLTLRDLDDPMLADVWGPRLTRLSLDLGDVEAGRITVQLKEAR